MAGPTLSGMVTDAADSIAVLPPTLRCDERRQRESARDSSAARRVGHDALAERQKLISSVARHKARSAAKVRDMVREEEILDRLVRRARESGLDGYFVTRLFNEIMDHSLRYQQEVLTDEENPERAGERVLVIAYQGTDGAYSHLAASRHFSARDRECIFQGYDTFKEILEAVRDGAADYAVLPIENTTAGSINNGTRLSSMRLAMAAIQRYGRYE